MALKAFGNPGTKAVREDNYKSTPTLPEGTTSGIIEKIETDKDEKFFFVTLLCTSSKPANIPADQLRPAYGDNPAETVSPAPAEVGKSYKKSVSIQTVLIEPTKDKKVIADNYVYKAMVDFLGGVFRIPVGGEMDLAELADRATNEKQELRGRTIIITSNRFTTKGGNVKTNWNWEVLEESNEDVQANLKALDAA